MEPTAGRKHQYALCAPMEATAPNNHHRRSYALLEAFPKAANQFVQCVRQVTSALKEASIQFRVAKVSTARAAKEVAQSARRVIIAL